MKKIKLIETINEFPKEVDLNDLFERLIFIDKVEKGMEQIANGETVSHEKVVASFRKKWQK